MIVQETVHQSLFECVCLLFVCVKFLCLPVYCILLYSFYSLSVVGMFWLASGQMMSLGQPPTVVAPPSLQAVGGTPLDSTQQ